MLPRIDPRTSSLIAQCFTHCCNLLFCLLPHIRLHLSTFMFSNFCFVPRQLHSLFITMCVLLACFRLPLIVFASIFNWSAVLVIISLLNTFVSSKLTLLTVSFLSALLNGFFLFNWNWLIIKLIWMLNFYNRDNYRWKKAFRILQPRIDPRTTSLTAISITHCSNLSFCLLFLICLWLSKYLFLNFCFVSRQLSSLFMIIVRT